MATFAGSAILYFIEGQFGSGVASIAALMWVAVSYLHLKLIRFQEDVIEDLDRLIADLRTELEEAEGDSSE